MIQRGRRWKISYSPRPPQSASAAAGWSAPWWNASLRCRYGLWWQRGRSVFPRLPKPGGKISRSVRIFWKKIRNLLPSPRNPILPTKHSTAREVIRLRREGKHVVIGLITDQSPNRNEAHHWTTFLNQDTVFMDGGERIARMMNYPVFYCELEKRGRGYCKAYFDLLTETPKQTAEGEITELFVRRLEQTIHRAPAYWFWSHKRWKQFRWFFWQMHQQADVHKLFNVILITWFAIKKVASFSHFCK